MVCACENVFYTPLRGKYVLGCVCMCYTTLKGKSFWVFMWGQMAQWLRHRNLRTCASAHPAVMDILVEWENNVVNGMKSLPLYATYLHSPRGDETVYI